MRVMGIDQSFTSCGIVVLDDGVITHHERFPSNVTQDEYDRAWAVAQHISDVIDQVKPDCIGIEGLAFGGFGNATRNLAGLLFVIMTTIRNSCGLKPVIFPPQHIKKFATTSGRADKKQMLEALPDNAKTILETNYKKTKGLYDVVDAYWIARCVDSIKT